MDPIRRQSRVAGALYLLVALVAPISLVVVPGRLFDPASAAVTAEHLRQGEGWLRLGIGCELFHQAVEVFLVIALYDLLRPVSQGLARQMVLLGLVPIPIMFVNVLNEVAALMLARGPDYLGVFDRAQLDALAMLFVKLHGQGVQVAAVFWGLWLFPLGLLVWRSGFIPKVIGALVMAAGVGYLLGATVTLVAPVWLSRVGTLTLVLETGELSLVLWLLVLVARSRPGAAVQRPA